MRIDQPYLDRSKNVPYLSFSSAQIVPFPKCPFSSSNAVIVYRFSKSTAFKVSEQEMCLFVCFERQVHRILTVFKSCCIQTKTKKVASRNSTKGIFDNSSFSEDWKPFLDLSDFVL